jgi:hypothetical protein
MPEAPGKKLTVRVGRREFEDLREAWAAYREVTDLGNGALDPVLAMRRSGDVLRSVDRFLATVDSEPEK